jgi:hypothetical protein
MEDNNIVGDCEDNCDAKKGHRKKIGPSNIRRDYAWGSDDFFANTALINVNKGFIAQLTDDDDVRIYYLMIGATWVGDTREATKLANSTVETFIQDSYCLECHSAERHRLSHIWDQLRPLTK